jgi:hypothetical protein
LSAALSVRGKYISNWLMDFEYKKNKDGTYTITGWKGTFGGIPSTICVFPDDPRIILELEE